MKICAVVWRGCGSNRDRFQFWTGEENSGEHFRRVLERVSGHRVDRILRELDDEMGPKPSAGEAANETRIIRAFGFDFLPEADGIGIRAGANIDYD